VLTINDEQLNITDGNNETLSDEPQQNAVFNSDVKTDDNPPAAKKPRSKVEIAINVALWAAIAILLVLVVLRLFVFNSIKVDGLSMSPTYEDGEIVVINKTVKPKRGDVVVFYLNDVDSKFKAMFASQEQCQPGQPYEKLIKRVVALGGDKIWTQRIAENGNDVMYQVVIDTADGKRIFEDYYVKKGNELSPETYYIHSIGLTDLGNLEGYTEQNPYVVKEGCFYAMGDNRVNSVDSRKFGEFPLSRLFGVVIK